MEQTHDEITARPIAELLTTTLETLAHASQSQTTPRQPLNANSSNAIDKQKAKQRWQEKWLQMKLHHPQLRAMADALYSFGYDVFHSPKSGRMLVIYGPNGCGKTHGARRFKAWFDTIRLAIGPVCTTTEEGEEALIPNCCYRMWPAVVKGFKQDQFLITDYLANEYLTMIDDIGAEHDPSKYGLEQLYLILSRREKKFTIITTNISPEQWEARFERRIASRMFRNSTHIDLTQVPDYNA